MLGLLVFGRAREGCRNRTFLGMKGAPHIAVGPITIRRAVKPLHASQLPAPPRFAGPQCHDVVTTHSEVTNRTRMNSYGLT
jgi:hypothetical protein